MTRLGLVLTVTFALTVAASAQTPPAAPEKTRPDATAAKSMDPPVSLYDEKADVKEQIAAALARAKRENRRVLIQWGGNWCGWCTRLHGLFKSDREIAKTLQYEYEIVYADAGKPAGKNVDFAATTYGADLKKNGYPFLTILDADGKTLANQETGVLENKDQQADPGHNTAAVLALLQKYVATPLDANKVLEAGLAEAKRDGKGIFLHAGAPWCVWCRRMDEWMNRDDIRPILAKAFVDLKIDVDRMRGGKELIARFADVSKTGLPWFAFLDADGKPIATSMDGGTNIGFPVETDEVAVFEKMLSKSTKNLSPDDVKKLLESLAALKKAAPRQG